MAAKDNAEIDKSQVRSALRAFDLLECFTPTRTEISLSVLAEEACLPASTTSRLLSTLVSSGYLRKTENGLYAYASRLLRIALTALQGMSIYELALPHLEAMRDATGESTNLAVPGSDGRPIYIRQAESRRAIRHNSWIGETLPIKGTAIGAAISGKVNNAGYSVIKGSIEPDVAAVAAPVHDSGGQIVAAFSITMPIFRATDAILEQYGQLVVKHSRKASTQLGYQQTAGGALDSKKVSGGVK